MPTVVVAPALARWLTPTPTVGASERRLSVSGSTVREVLDSVFTEFPTLRGYAVDERGRLRHHVVVYLDGSAIQDKDTLSEPVADTSELYLFQALSGG